MQENDRPDAGETQEKAKAAPDTEPVPNLPVEPSDSSLFAGLDPDSEKLLMGYWGVETSEPGCFKLRLRRKDGEEFDLLVNAQSACEFGDHLTAIGVNLAHGRVGG